MAVFLACSLPIPGLHAEDNLQAFLSSLLRGRRGAAIVSNPMTGELLAIENPRMAMDRAFPPGSTAKLVEAAAALEEGVISPGDRIFCRRVPEVLGQAYHCSHPRLGEPLTISSALANSCNYFFATLSLRLSSAGLAHWYSVFGFGSSEEGLGASTGAGRVSVGDGAAEKARAALGEGTILATPAQLLLAYSAVATGGVFFPLHATAREPSPLLHRVKLQPRTLEVLAAGLEQCVQSGSCQAAGVAGIRVAGKTGTASALDGSGATHAWFVGYAPVDAPEIALVVFLERGRGARDAAPLAGKILQHYFGLKQRRL